MHCERDYAAEPIVCFIIQRISTGERTTWTDEAGPIPDGYLRCDGQHHTPDLRDLVIDYPFHPPPDGIYR